MADNLLPLIRRNNTFSIDSPFMFPVAEEEPMFEMPRIRPTNTVADDYNPAARMSELYQPETTMTDKYSEALGRMPVRNKPGLLRKILAGVAAFGSAPNNAEQVLYGPYHRQMQDWGAEIDPLREGANMERQNNANLRMVANQIISQEQADRRIETTIGRNRVLQEQGDARIAQGDERIAQGEAAGRRADARLKIAEEVAKGGQFEVDDAGNAMIVRRDGTTIPVEAQYLTEEEKSALRVREQAAGAGARAAATAANQRPRMFTAEIDDPENPGQKILVNVNRETNEATPVTVRPPTGSRPVAQPQQTQLEQGRETVNKAQAIKNSNPRWNRWITIQGNTVTIQRPGMFTGPSQEEYDQIYQQIFGTMTPTRRNEQQRTTTPGSNTVPAGKVRVRRTSDGQTGLMDANDPALRSGRYQIIQEGR